jgi:hypothetical protein
METDNLLQVQAAADAAAQHDGNSGFAQDGLERTSGGHAAADRMAALGHGDGQRRKVLLGPPAPGTRVREKKLH